ncbi:hypothetical protein IOQ59_11295 [Pontibacterium sp. N1Y112]|uniref:Uncharacterized protein n=1 Tax=Pontibacterium sinense TaxID=2781979 RepID=A0A8J7FKD1_9GAMM|nr:hypothetical protein [Pontibacterium sinense]MBE9397843.1 hypothetical protein [Pontibacterium sinense]
MFLISRGFNPIFKRSVSVAATTAGTALSAMQLPPVLFPCLSPRISEDMSGLISASLSCNYEV